MLSELQAFKVGRVALRVGHFLDFYQTMREGGDYGSIPILFNVKKSFYDKIEVRFKQ